MAAQSRQRTRNPHLGAYYGTVTSAFVALVILLAMFEELGWREDLIAKIMILVPLLLYLLIAVASRTSNIEDFFASGRRVPPVFNGFVLAATAIGGVGFVAYTGTVLFLGFDALAIGLGWTCGMLAAAALFVPYLRKAGAYTLPSFLGHRFRSLRLRLAAAVMQIPPTALLLAAEIKIAALIASLILPLSFSAAVLSLATLLAAITVIGGMRALTWSGSAEFIVCGVGLAVTMIIVSILLTNLPAPQLTYGELFPSLQNAEITAGLTPVGPEDADASLPSTAPTAVRKPFLEPFGIFSRFDFVMLFLSLVLGTAALPSLLVRSGVTLSRTDQRRSTAWGVVFVALFAITAPAIAAFAKLMIFQGITVSSASALPGWLTELSGRQLIQAGDVNGDGAIRASELLIARDGITLALPILAKLPYVCTVLLAASGLAVALAAAGSHLFTLGSSLAEDLYSALDRRSTALPRLAAAWAAIAATALAAAVFLVIADVDPLRAAITALAFAAATFFPVLVLAIWWRGCTAWGALAAMGTGFTIMLLKVTAGAMIGGDAGAGTAIASLLGALLATGAGVGASLYGPRASEAATAYCTELRDPGGEAIYDRVQQRAAASAAAAPAIASAE
jgi:cation/acetate symporter